MRIEKCVESESGKITVYVDDDTVRATDNEAAVDLINVLNAAAGSTKWRPKQGESNEQA